MSSFDSKRGPPEIEGMTSLKVDNLTYRTTIGDLEHVFSKYGELGDVYIPRDRYKQESRGFAFVRFYERRDAEDAMDALHGKVIDGREIRVQMAKYGRPTDPYKPRNNRYRSSYVSSSRYRSRSRSPKRRDRRSRSRSPRKHRSRSRSRSPRRPRRTTSGSPRRQESRSRSRSPMMKKKRSPSRSRSKSGSKSRPSPSKSRSRSRSPVNRKSKSLSRSPRQQKSPSPERGSDGLRRDNGSLEENNQKSVYDDDDDADNRND
ncbi:PREDICTED: serine/arginine-rich splicing factor 2-like [Acropora digitifera]|uniref:serine/arginine-rich splicing factor 2-like n=1 Tax=Acropora digitifera TaxID=70779 RepID=UPI00077A7794|nr:PREDICTED: serine/arginine-rich splicing factor 2-like [Acropora digitifera]